MTIKVIPTKYNSVLFRSRLEARWAVFFDCLKIDWLYEFEGYDLNGVWYLPDFYLPKYNDGCYVEVKPTDFTDYEHNKLIQLCKNTEKVVFKAVGTPDLKMYEVYFPGAVPDCDPLDIGDYQDYDPNFMYEQYSQFFLNHKSDSKKRFWVEPCPWTSDGYSDELINAVNIAKSYRF